MEEVRHLKETAIEIFARGHFQLHKWHSNEEELESTPQENNGSEAEQSYAKQKLRVRNEEAKLLGLSWNKVEDKLGVTFPVVIDPKKVTKENCS